MDFIMYDELAIGLRYCLSRADAELEPFKVFGGFEVVSKEVEKSVLVEDDEWVLLE